MARSLKRQPISEANINTAIQSYHEKAYPSIRAAARAFNVPPPTLHARLAGRTSRSTIDITTL
ncbi:hypothetical protein M433DRAFT_8760 [Acidomyces richmondensis BFW]|nr:MAG: hypothetical protein FE78DRAFT_32046 [Acidomyces sp. 'richmondensis']KYG40481.1 hypothetical protein M433DRAFT_8760 [Acidomyces richmondensis BFW]